MPMFLLSIVRAAHETSSKVTTTGVRVYGSLNYGNGHWCRASKYSKSYFCFFIPRDILVRDEVSYRPKAKLNAILKTRMATSPAETVSFTHTMIAWVSHACCFSALCSHLDRETKTKSSLPALQFHMHNSRSI